MNPYSHQDNNLQQPNHHVFAQWPVVYYPAPNYVDDVAILNTPDHTMLSNQEYTQSMNHYASYQNPEDVFLDTSSGCFMNAFEAFLQQSLIIQESGTRSTGDSGLSEEEIYENLHVYQSQGMINANCEHEEVDVCSICLDEFGKDEKIGRLKCEHRFHADFIKRWLLTKNACPMCRSTARVDGVDIDFDIVM